MTLAESLMLIASWCGMSTYSRANAPMVNTCRETVMQCIGLETLAKTASFGPNKDLARLTLKCVKEQKLVD